VWLKGVTSSNERGGEQPQGIETWEVYSRAWEGLKRGNLFSLHITCKGRGKNEVYSEGEKSTSDKTTPRFKRYRARDGQECGEKVVGKYCIGSIRSLSGGGGREPVRRKSPRRFKKQEIGEPNSTTSKKIWILYT